jgi:hypothetical protein
MQRRRDTPSPIHQWTGDANGRDDARTEYYPGLSTTTYARANAETGVPALAVYPFTDDDMLTLTEPQAIATLKCLSLIPSPEFAMTIGVSVIVNLIVTICNQGTISSHFIEKISHAVQQDIGRKMQIKAGYARGAYGQYVKEGNVGRLMEYFLDHIMAESIRLRVTV